MKTQQISDQELINHYLGGNEACLEMLIKRHKKKVFSTIYLIVQDTYIAEDLFQETFIKVIHTLRSEKYNEEGKFQPWLIRIARNLSIDYFRKAKRNPTITDSKGNDIFSYIQIAEDSYEDKMIKAQTEIDLRKLIQMLPPEQKEVLIMRHYGELSFKEIAEQTHVSINTALGRMRYALNNLRKLIVEKQISI
jgi:RNA polymerase sigma factor (sigma-70 family)